MKDKRKTLRDYIENRELTNFPEHSGKRIWFVSKRYNGIYCIRELGLADKSLLIGFKAYHKYVGGMVGCSSLDLHLDDVEATQKDHKRYKKEANEYWSNLSFEKQYELVQFAYDMGEDVPQEDIDKYKIGTID